MEVAVNDNEEELVSFFQSTGAVEVKVALIIDMKSVYKITLLFGITILVSCHNNAAPNYQFSKYV
jgi:hypothetical protein